MAQSPELTISFEKLVSEILVFLFVVNNPLPGPQHPAVTYYQKRKQIRENNTDSRQKRVTETETGINMAATKNARTLLLQSRLMASTTYES